ncbi:MAG: RlmE family RNA methyltransferase [Rhodoferax sp.]
MKSSKSGKVNRAWLHEHLTDPYVRQAQKDGYRARAAYKLQEIDAAFNLLRPGQVVVDLGSAPGAWSQYVRRRLGPASAGDGAAVVALDVLPMEPIAGVQFLQGDIRAPEVLEALAQALQGRAVDVVLSDMAPNLSGIATVDAARVEHLVELALDFAVGHLQPKGVFVAKVFHGGSYDTLVRAFRQCFASVKPFKPKASRDRSAETFLVGTGPIPAG